MISAISSLCMFKDKNLDGSMVETAHGAPLVTPELIFFERARADETETQRAVSRCALVSLSTSASNLAFELKLEMVGTRGMALFPPPPPTHTHTHTHTISQLI